MFYRHVYAVCSCTPPPYPSSYRCGNGHVHDRCHTRESLTYESIAQRVLINCDFLLRLRPAISGVELPLVRQNSSRVRRLLRVKSISYAPHQGPAYPNKEPADTTHATATAASTSTSQNLKDKVRAIKSETQATKWRELRNELLSYRPDLVKQQSIPIVSLVLTFAKDTNVQSSSVAQHLEHGKRAGEGGCDGLCICMTARELCVGCLSDAAPVLYIISSIHSPLQPSVSPSSAPNVVHAGWNRSLCC